MKGSIIWLLERKREVYIHVLGAGLHIELAPVRTYSTVSRDTKARVVGTAENPRCT